MAFIALVNGGDPSEIAQLGVVGPSGFFHWRFSCPLRSASALAFESILFLAITLTFSRLLGSNTGASMGDVLTLLRRAERRMRTKVKV